MSLLLHLGAIFISLYFLVEQSYCCFWRECKADFFYGQGFGFNRRLQNPFWSCGCIVLLIQYNLIVFVEHRSRCCAVLHLTYRCDAYPSYTNGWLMSRGMPHFLLVSNTTVTFLPHRLLLIILELVIPLLLDDTRRVMESWGASGKFDPFVNVYEVRIARHLFTAPHTDDYSHSSSYSNLLFVVCHAQKFLMILCMLHDSKSSTIYSMLERRLRLSLCHGFPHLLWSKNFGQPKKYMISSLMQ